VIRRSGDDDGIEGRVFFPTVVTIALLDLHVGIAQIAQSGGRMFGQFRDDFDAVDFDVPQLGEHRRLVA